MKRVDALLISDVHLGSKGCNAEKLLEVLKEYEPKELIIVGDFIDGWLLKKRFYWPQSHTNVLRKILSYSKNGTKVHYITGNHDEYLRNYTPLILGNIEIKDDMVWNNYYITHGDLYDGVVQLKWLGHLGSWGYELAIWVDRTLKKMGYKKSLSAYLKLKVKEAVKFITRFEQQLEYQAEKRNCSGVICGHIHTPALDINRKIHYINCGDWIENNSYIVYDQNTFKSYKRHINVI